ncbi:MAG TPA: acetolactate synthase large subunit [Methanothermococcus okinawensis]|uniref:Acetolactate synthase n=1 Tax=Methanothermococcus okinawensis TaxID=155863 RepID=A0A832ZBX3_9EURY|nr:acetolactate synthase large subunit [Methanothermococcus okinawensis]
MRGAEAFIKALEYEGVKVIFGYPGGALLPFYDALYDSDLIHILTRHEQGAAHAADGYARVSGKVGVCVGTSGPGATNLVTGVATAYADSSPLVAITGQVPTRLIGNDAFQEIDALGIFMPIVKHNFQIRRSKDIPGTVRAAFEIAKTGRPGPVHIDLPKDVQEEEFNIESNPIPAKIDLPGYKPTVKGHPKQIKMAVNAIIAAERPVIIAGGGVNIANGTEELVKLAELCAIPVCTTLMGKGSFPEEHPLALGMVGMHGTKPANYAVSECDLLIAIGCRFSDRITGDIRSFAPYAKVIHIDIDPAEIGKNVDVDIPIVGDAKLVMRDIISSLLKSCRTGEKVLNNQGREEWLKYLESLKRSSIPKMDYDHTPIKPQRIVKELMDVIQELKLKDKFIITTDVGQNQMWMAHYFKVHLPRTFISSGGLGTMGFGLPAAIGAKIARPEAKVVCVTGDGGFMMNIQELGTIADYGIPVVICIFDNRTLGMVYQWQNLFYRGRQCSVTFGESPDFVKVAKGYGIKAQRVTDPSDIKEVLKEALLSDEPYLIDFVIDPSEGLPMVPPGEKLKNIIEPVKAYPKEKIPSFQEIKKKLLGDSRERSVSKDIPQDFTSPVEREMY